MLIRIGLLFCAAVSLFAAAIPTPTEHLGYRPGTDYKLADYNEIMGYYQKLEKVTGRMKLMQYGRTSMGKPMYVALISSEENLKNLDKYKEMNRRMALGLASKDEALKISREGKVFVWIDAGIHATETSCPQGSPELTYKMITDESDEMKKIRDRVILVQVPVINPDGLDMVAHWWAKNAGTEYETAALPELYQKYAGHDNNRDWFMYNLDETKHSGRLLFQEWFPQIMYNQHQAPAYPARIFVPPYAEPMNPMIPAPVMEGINMIGSSIRERLAREGKTGVLSYYGYDGWWNGGLRSAPAFHNMHGILTETAMQPYAIPKEYKLEELPNFFPNGMPTKQATIFYTPWTGGKWGLRDAIEYMLTVDMAILNLAASMPDQWIYKAWDLARKNIEEGEKAKPFAYIVPPDQWDPWTASEMLRRLQLGGVQVQKSKSEIRMGDKTYPAGSYVMLAGQAFRGYLVDLMETQTYPELRNSGTGPTKRPYDVAGWTLPLQMGVKVDRITDRFDTSSLQMVGEVPAAAWSMDHKDNSSFLTVADMLSKGQKVGWAADGKIVKDGFAWELNKPRVALYEPYISNMDQGWTQWVLEYFHISYTLLHNADIQKGGLKDKFDTVIFAQQAPESILHGLRAGGGSEEGGDNPNRGRSRNRPEQLGGIGAQGVAALDTFVREGGSLLTFSTASELPMEFLSLPVRAAASGVGVGRNSAGSETGFYSPGSLLRATVDTTNPLAFGMPKEAVLFSAGGPVMDISGAGAKSVVNFAKKDLLASGWLSGERAVLGKSVMVEATVGKGRVVMYGFRVQHRGQPFGTFKLLLNAIYLGSARKL